MQQPTSVINLYSPKQLKTIADSFCNELTATLEGTPTSLSFLKHTLPQTSLVQKNESFQVMIIGGTNFTSYTFPHPPNLPNSPNLPTFSSDDVFFHFIEKHLDPTVKTLAINFAYSLKPDTTRGFLDGILTHGTKEHTFTGLVGKPIGRTIEEYIYKTHKRKIQVTVANDTVCLLLSSLTQKNWDSTVAGVIGTGTNYAITHERAIINLESGNFNKFPQSETGKQIDKDSLNPGKQLFEKEVSGAYLYKHFSVIPDEVMSVETQIRDPVTKNKPLQSTEELSILAQHSKDLNQQLMAQTLLERSAQLSATQIAGFALYKKTKGINHLTFVMEGTLYWDGWHYKEMVTYYIQQLNLIDMITFQRSTNHGIQGAIRLTGLPI